MEKTITMPHSEYLELKRQLDERPCIKVKLETTTWEYNFDWANKVTVKEDITLVAALEKMEMLVKKNNSVSKYKEKIEELQRYCRDFEADVDNMRFDMSQMEYAIEESFLKAIKYFLVKRRGK